MMPTRPRAAGALLLAALASSALLRAGPADAQTPPAPPPELQAKPEGPKPSAQVMPAATFLERIVASNAFEVESARIALERSRNPEVRAFAETILRDHEKVRLRLEKTVAGISPPLPLPAPALSPEQTARLDELRRAGDAAFGPTYSAVQITAHLEAVNLLRFYIRNNDAPALREFARVSLPEFEHHLSTTVALRQRAAVSQ